MLSCYSCSPVASAALALNPAFMFFMNSLKCGRMSANSGFARFYRIVSTNNFMPMANARAESSSISTRDGILRAMPMMSS